MKIIVITDVHANLPALEAVLKAAQAEGYDLLIQTGDIIAIGPYPSECLELILKTPRVENIKGNHELYFVDGIPEPRPEYMSEGEIQHQRWTHSQLTDEQKSILAGWSLSVEHEFEGIRAVFLHSRLDESGREFLGIPKNLNGSVLDNLFGDYQADLVFYGHRHDNSDVQGKMRYVNPGSLGCSLVPVARFCVAQFQQGRVQIEHRRVVYDDRGLFQAFEARQVPDRQFIYKTFFGSRFG